MNLSNSNLTIYENNTFSVNSNICKYILFNLIGTNKINISKNNTWNIPRETYFFKLYSEEINK